MGKMFRYTTLAVLFVPTGFLGAQEPIPVAEPVEAEQQVDKLRVADILYADALASREVPAQYRRNMELAASHYSEYIRENPESPQVAKATYQLANCLMATGQTAAAYQTFASILQRYRGDIAAAAAYRLALEAYKTRDWPNAERFFLTTIRESTKADFRADARYRLGLVYRQDKKSDKALEQFRAIIDDGSAPDMHRRESTILLADILADSGKHAEAYEIYKKLLQDPGLDVRARGNAMLNAASLATLLNKQSEADAYYSQIVNNPDFVGRTAEAQAKMLFGLYKQGKYEDVVRFYEQGQIESDNKQLEARRRLVVGQAAYKLKDYERARILFTLAEKSVPHTELAMEAAYCRLMVQRELKEPGFAMLAENFLNAYSQAFPASNMPNMVCLMAAEHLFSSNPATASTFYERVNRDRIDPSLKDDVLYRHAWACSRAGNRERAIMLLDEFIHENPQDSRMPEALALRGDMNLQTGRDADALRDFQEVIRKWPRNEAAALAWQKTGQLYERKQDAGNMIKAYEGLINNFPKVMPVALADARFKIGLGYLEQKKYRDAIPHFEEARTLNPEKYAAQVDRRLVQAYYQMEDAASLKNALESMRKKDPKSLEGVPDAITAWLGLYAYGTGDYAIADRYLTLATRNNELNQVKRIIWKNLAKTRLALKKYETALVAVDFYLQEERQPYGRIEGQLDRSAILLGLGKYEDARKMAEAALQSGVEGPLMASLKIILGDIAYAEKKYDEAAKQYIATADLFVSDQQLKPEALYKAHAALMKAGRVADAAQYKTALEKEFSEWRPGPQQELPQAVR